MKHSETMPRTKMYKTAIISKGLIKTAGPLAVLLAAVLMLLAPQTRIVALAAPVVMPDGTVFDASFYAAFYPDLQAAYGNDEQALWNHYVVHGRGEGRFPNGAQALASAGSIAGAPDVTAAGKTDAGAAKESNAGENTAPESSTGGSGANGNNRAESSPDGSNADERNANGNSTRETLVPGNGFASRIRSDKNRVISFGETGATAQELETLTGYLNGYKRGFSFKAVSVDGTKALAYNSSRGYFSACTIKAPYALYCYQEMESGNGTLMEDITFHKRDYLGGTGTIKKEKIGTVFTVRDVLCRTIWQSDNSGYAMIFHKYGYKGYNEMVKALGANSLTLGNESWWGQNVTAEDMVIAWKAIHTFFEKNNYYSRAFYDSCTPGQYDFFSAISDQAVVSQKVGFTDRVYGASGIIRPADGQAYIISFYIGSGGDEYDKKVVDEAMRQIFSIMTKRG